MPSRSSGGISWSSVTRCDGICSSTSCSRDGILSSSRVIFVEIRSTQARELASRSSWIGLLVIYDISNLSGWSLLPPVPFLRPFPLLLPNERMQVLFASFCFCVAQLTDFRDFCSCSMDDLYILSTFNLVVLVSCFYWLGSAFIDNRPLRVATPRIPCFPVLKVLFWVFKNMSGSLSGGTLTSCAFILFSHGRMAWIQLKLYHQERSLRIWKRRWWRLSLFTFLSESSSLMTGLICHGLLVAFSTFPTMMTSIYVGLLVAVSLFSYSSPYSFACCRGGSHFVFFDRSAFIVFLCCHISSRASRDSALCAMSSRESF